MFVVNNHTEETMKYVTLTIKTIKYDMNIMYLSSPSQTSFQVMVISVADFTSIVSISLDPGRMANNRCLHDVFDPMNL